MGRKGSHTTVGKEGANGQSVLAGLVLHMVPGDGAPVADEQSGYVWQSDRASAHLQAGMEQEYLLQTALATRTQLGIYPEPTNQR